MEQFYQYNANNDKVEELNEIIQQKDQEISRLREELRTAKFKAKQVTLIKNEFIRNMEHDIRTPFSGVWGMAYYLMQNEQDPQKKEFLSDIINCAKELLDYCNSILDFSKIELGTLPIIRKKFDTKKVIDGVMRVETPPAKVKNLQFFVDYKTEVPPVLIGDQYRLQRILINLISNAIKFTHDGFVKLTVSVAKHIDAKNIILTFSVQDTGIGIPRENQDFIYEKFTRVNPSNRGLYKGLGLGLRIVKQFVDEMGGEIDLASQIGQGSIFTCHFPFTIPLVDDMVEY